MVMPKDEDVPEHPLAAGIMVMVAVIGPVVPLDAVKPGISPLPEAANPMDGSLFVQLKVVPVTGPDIVIAEVRAPVQKVWFATEFTVGVGFTVMVKSIGAPEQPLAEGVTVMVAVTGAEELLVAVKEGMLPIPFAPKPIDGVLLTHEKVVPGTGPEKGTAGTASPAQ
jgi:hypothetical protein